jgi:ribosome-binding protein aMBF1 (putative translation factor)
MEEPPRKRLKPNLRNAIGLEIRKRREEKGWSQLDLARELQLSGWDVDRTVLTKIELRRRCVTDFEMLLLAKTLGVSLNEFAPKRISFSDYF